jgi:hypothetical protein
MSGRSRRPYHVRAYLGAELYERILRDAVVERRSVSECVHDALEELYAIRDELNRPVEMAGREGSVGSVVAHRLLNQLEERLTGALTRQLEEIRALSSLLRRLEVMADRQYVSLMLYLPDVDDALAEERSVEAMRRYQSWCRAVAKLLKSGEISSWPDE